QLVAAHRDPQLVLRVELEEILRRGEALRGGGDLHVEHAAALRIEEVVDVAPGSRGDRRERVLDPVLRSGGTDALDLVGEAAARFHRIERPLPVTGDGEAARLEPLDRGVLGEDADTVLGGNALAVTAAV